MSEKYTISFKRLKRSHLPILLEWLNASHVQEFWDTGTVWTEQLVQAKYGSYVEGYKLVDGKKLPLQAFIIYCGAGPIGYIQFYDAFLFPRDSYSLQETLKDTPFETSRLAAIDIFIGDKRAVGQGMGPLAMKQFLTEYVWKSFEGCLVDPEKTNERAIRAYEKSGFSKIKDTPDHKANIMIASL